MFLPVSPDPTIEAGQITVLKRLKFVTVAIPRLGVRDVPVPYGFSLKRNRVGRQVSVDRPAFQHHRTSPRPAGIRDQSVPQGRQVT